MEDLDYALRMIPPSLRLWVLKSLRSGSSSPEQVVSRFTTSKQDPAYQPMLRGLLAAKHAANSYLELRLKAIDQR